MKVSIVTQYYNRRTQFTNTIDSILESKHEEIELIIVDDASDVNHDISDFPEKYGQIDIKYHRFEKSEKWWLCPVLVINKGISMATGDVLIFLGAECMFVGDVVSDVVARIQENKYLVYATLGINEDDTNRLRSLTREQMMSLDGIWYQHSTHRNTCYNFCTAITRKDLDELGGFDERFAAGVAFGDDDFINRVRIKGMDVVPVDDPLTIHQYHPPMNYYEHDERSKKESKFYFADNVLMDYIRQNEIENFKVNNSFVNGFGMQSPVYSKMVITRDILINVENKDGKSLVNFGAELSGLVLDLKFTTLEGYLIHSTKLLCNHWYSLPTGPVVCLSISVANSFENEYTIYQEVLTEGFSKTMNFKIPIQAHLLSI